MSEFSRLIIAACVLLTASFGGCVLAAQPVAERTELRAVYGDFFPYGFTGEDGEPQGYSVDLIPQLAMTAGYEIQFVPAENPRQFLAMLAKGDVDLTTLLALTPERRASGLATASLGEYVLSVYVRQDSAITDINAILGQRIGVVVGAITQSAAALLPHVELVEYQTHDAVLLPLLRGEIDAVVAVSEAFEERLRASFIRDKVRRLAPPLAITPYGIIVRHDLPEVHAAFEAAIKQTVSIKSLEALHAKWFGSDRSIVEHPWFDNVAIIVGGAALTTLALGIYAFRLRRRSGLLATEYGANQLLIDAFDQTRAAIAIFDWDMRAVHWNSGFEVRFPEIVPDLKRGATLEKICISFHDVGIIASQLDHSEIDEIVAATVDCLREGQSKQEIVHTQHGSSFDLSMFPLGARYYAAIWVDVTELHDQQKKLADQSCELGLRNQQLLAFSAMAAHDLKAPLIQQKLLVEFITEDLIDAQISLPDEAKSHIATLGDLSGRMSLLVSDMLDYAKADSKHAPSTAFVPNTRLEGIVKLAAPNAQMKIVIAADMPSVQVEPICFDMVMRNLITNAAKHHDRRKGIITMRGYRRGAQVVIEVEDDGPGIKPSDQKRVFEPFARLTKVEGTGLGLAFVQRTVAAWGGEISLSAAQERGCIFSVSIPAAFDEVLAIPLPDTVDASHHVSRAL